MRRLIYLALVISLVACGGGGSSDASTGVGATPDPVVSPAPEAPSVPPALAPPAAAPLPKVVDLVPNSVEACDESKNADVFSGISLRAVHPINAKAHSCLIVDGKEGFPVKSGSKSLRIEVRPGDCSSNAGFDDCPTDRSRHEVGEYSDTALVGRTVTYVQSLFIPSQTKLRPSGGNLLVLSQVNYADATTFGALAYLTVTSAGDLAIQTHKGFTFDILNVYSLGSVPYDRWVTIRYEVKSTIGADGYIRVSVDGKELVNETRPTALSASTHTSFRVGIYNSFKSKALEPYSNQLVFFDDVGKLVN